MSRSGYLYQHVEIGWLESDFRTPPSEERNINIIGQINNQKLRNLTLRASLVDKDIQPAYRDLVKLRKNREDKALRDGGITFKKDLESDYQKIADRHIKIVVMPYEEWLGLHAQQYP